MTPDIPRIASIIRDVTAEQVIPRWKKLGVGEVMRKAGPEPDDLVTVADRACEQALGPRLCGTLPGSVVVGEEAVSANKDLLRLLDSDQAAWVVDPIDGTASYAAGRNEFDVMVALVKGGALVAGWIYAPVADEMYLGEKGGGVFHDRPDGPRKKLSPVKKRPVATMTGIVGLRFFQNPVREALKAKIGGFARWKSTICAGHDYARLLRGEAQFAVYRKTMPWDHAPGLALAEELGFSYRWTDDRPYSFADPCAGENPSTALLVAPREQWDEISGRINSPPPPARKASAG